MTMKNATHIPMCFGARPRCKVPGVVLGSVGEAPLTRDDMLSRNFSPGTTVCAITYACAHTCDTKLVCKEPVVTKDNAPQTPSGRARSVASQGAQDQHVQENESEYHWTDTEEVAAKADMGSPELRSEVHERSLTAEQLVHALRPSFEKARKSTTPWTIRACAEAIREIDQGAVKSAGLVLRKLKALHALPSSVELELVQGLVVQLQTIGFGAVLHTAKGSSTKLQVHIT